VDTTPPTVTLNSPINPQVLVYTQFIDPGVTITDVGCSNLKATVTGNVNTSQIGTYTVTYKVTDCNKNGPVTVVRTVNVVDTIPPVIKYTGSDTIILDVYSYYHRPDFISTDNYYTTASLTEVISSSTFFTAFPTGKASLLGYYDVVYKITDGSGESTTKRFVIHVVDREKPVIILSGLASVNICRYEVLDAANNTYTVKDNFDNSITATVGGTYITNYLVNFNAGYYTLTHNAVDNSGNKATEVTRHINVAECNLSVKGGGLDEYVKLYPNPNSGMFTMDIQLPKFQDITVNIINSMGQTVKKMSEKNSRGGIYQVDLSNYSDGVYMVRINTGNEVTVKRVTVTR
jgi:hypothetical protein